jgi:hypothetical protein
MPSILSYELAVARVWWKTRSGAFFRLVNCTTNVPPASEIPAPREDAGLAAERGRGAGPARRPVASGQIKLRRIDDWRKIATVLSQPTPAAASQRGWAGLEPCR